MKKGNRMRKIINFVLIGITITLYSKASMVKRLDDISPQINQYKEIATQSNVQLPALWNNLTPQERIFAYYLYRASIPGNRIAADQTHRDAVELTELFEKIILNKEAIKLQCKSMLDVEAFLSEAETFLVYLYAHHGQYFLKEFANHKRTPESLQLNNLNSDNIIAVLKVIGIQHPTKLIERLYKSLFDAHYEPTVTVDGSIEQSAVNIYSQDFTQADFDALDQEAKSVINAYFYTEQNAGKRVSMSQRYKIGGKYSAELEVVHYWLTKAHDYSLKHPDLFDKHIPASLKHMLKFLETGDENDFRKCSIEWLKTNSRIDFSIGFIEVYHDPMQYRGAFAADVTVKVVDMKKLNALLPELEQSLPFPDEFKRQNLQDHAAIPNASVNAKIFAAGDLGPVKVAAAYCLPNYSDIRAQYGSKQIIYQLGKGIGELINPTLSLKLFNIKEEADWLELNDPQRKLNHDIWDVQVVLHETLGHGSGRDAQHTFVEGDPLVIDGQKYNIGDVIAVTDTNSTEFIGGYSSAFEELRAEIIALYTSIFSFDALDASGLYKGWTQKIGKEKLIECFILHMAKVGLYRLLTQSDNAVEIVQAHAQANTAILNYLLDHGSLELVEEVYPVNGIEHKVIGVRLTDLNKAMQAVKDLACLVQRYKSTADGQGVERLMKKYGTCVRHPEYIKILKDNRKAVQGDLKEVAEIFPSLMPELDENGAIVDISASWPASFIEQQLELGRLALSKK